jgi:phosphoglycolate phosphatase-like HAD superfamily hydrolase
MDGIAPFLAWLEAKGLRRGLVTRNSRKSVELVLSRLRLRFDTVVTREDAPPKPAPDPVWHACRGMQVDPSEALLVGDFEFDMVSGRRAGTRTVLLRSGTMESSAHADLTVDSLDELQAWMETSDFGDSLSAPAASGPSKA